MSSRRWPALMSAALSLLAVVAIAVTVPHVIAVEHRHPSTATAQHDPPALAARNGKQLAGLLPIQGDYPTGWLVEPHPAAPSDGFGYTKAEGVGDCHTLSSARDDYVDGAGVDGHAGPYSSKQYFDSVDIWIVRDFRPSSLDELIALAHQCDGHGTVTIVDETHAGEEPRRFRYVYTENLPGKPAWRCDNSLVQLPGLLIGASAHGGDHRQLMDQLVELTLRRVRAS